MLLKKKRENVVISPTISVPKPLRFKFYTISPIQLFSGLKYFPLKSLKINRLFYKTHQHVSFLQKND